MDNYSNQALDMRCPECGEMMTSHIVETRHATGSCHESFSGPEITFASVSVPENDVTFWTNQVKINFELGYQKGKLDALAEFARSLLNKEEDNGEVPTG